MNVPAPQAPEDRGRTEIADRVLERIAARALMEVEEVAGAARRVLGMPLGRDASAHMPQVTAHVYGRLATVQMRISVVYPAPVRAVTRRLRDHVISRVGELTGLDVRQVDIDIARLIPPRRRGGRVL